MICAMLSHARHSPEPSCVCLQQFLVHEPMGCSQHGQSSTQSRSLRMLVREADTRPACYVAIPWLLRPALPQAHETLNPDPPCFTRPPQYELTGACSPACGAALGSLDRRSLHHRSLHSVAPLHIRSHHRRSLYRRSLSVARDAAHLRCRRSR